MQIPCLERYANKRLNILNVIEEVEPIINIFLLVESRRYNNLRRIALRIIGHAQTLIHIYVFACLYDY